MRILGTKPAGDPMAETIFHVFVSSTYADLADERRNVSEALSKAGLIVVGMEIFPATNRDQLDFIKKMIDKCDYYVVIVGGRYGSLADGNVSYTEKEYEYAISKGLPVLAFLHKSPETIEARKLDSKKKLAASLKRFRDRLSRGRIVDFWGNAHELSTKVVTAVLLACKDEPGIGWVRPLAGIESNENRPSFNTLHSIKKWSYMKVDLLMKYSGTYIFFYKTLTEKNTVAACLLEVFEGDGGSAEFRLYNVDNRFFIEGRPAVYIYNGFVSIIADSLYMFGDEVSLDEIFCIVLSSSQLSPPSDLRGHMMAVGVKPGVRMPSGSIAAATFCSRRIVGLENMLPKLGIFNETDIDNRIARLLDIL